MTRIPTIPSGGALRTLALVALVWLGTICPANAYYLPLLFDPEQPVEGEVGQVIVRLGGCDGIFGGQTDTRILTVEGNVIRIEFNGVTTSIGIPGACLFPLTSARFNLVPLDTGDYVVELYRRNAAGNLGVDLVVSGTLTVLPAQGQAPAHPIPALGPWLLALLAGALGVFALSRFRG